LALAEADADGGQAVPAEEDGLALGEADDAPAPELPDPAAPDPAPPDPVPPDPAACAPVPPEFPEPPDEVVPFLMLSSVSWAAASAAFAALYCSRALVSSILARIWSWSTLSPTLT
jgi:hypothetical protein